MKTYNEYLFLKYFDFKPRTVLIKFHRTSAADHLREADDSSTLGGCWGLIFAHLPRRVAPVVIGDGKMTFPSIFTSILLPVEELLLPVLHLMVMEL